MFRNNDVSDGGRRALMVAPDYAQSPLVALADVKKALGFTDDAQDDAIQAALDSVVADLDPASEGWLGRSLGVAEWELRLRDFDDRRRAVCPMFDPLEIPLPYPPLIEIMSVTYVDAAGVDVALDQGVGYRVLGLRERSQAIAPPFGRSWPAARADAASVRVRYSAGYDGLVNVMPKQLTQAIALGVRAVLPIMTRDQMLLEDRVEGLGAKRYQSNPEFADIARRTMVGVLGNLVVI